MYAKKEKKGVWLCVCLDRNQLPQRCVDMSFSPLLLTRRHAVALPLGAPIAAALHHSAGRVAAAVRVLPAGCGRSGEGR